MFSVSKFEQFSSPLTVSTVYHMHNATSGVNQKCISATPAADQWKCFFAQYTMPYTQSRIFAVQSLYDYNQLHTVLSLNCTPPNCSAAEMQQFLGWREVSTLFTIVLRLIRGLINV